MASDDSNTLNALSSLLSAHRATLCGLYQCLGAPSETVDSKLRELRNELFKTIETQRSTAEQEVERVRENVKEAENAISRMRTNLGDDVTEL